MRVSREMSKCMEALEKVNSLKALVGNIESLSGSEDLLIILELAIIHRLLNIEEQKGASVHVH